MRPPCAATRGSNSALRLLLEPRERAGLVALHQAAVADDVGGQDDGQFALHDSKRGAHLTMDSIVGAMSDQVAGRDQGGEELRFF